jgi:hypothetical protein
MLFDIAGNTFSSLGNISPSIVYQPQQIFGTGLTIWWDFSDKTILFSNTAATINIVNNFDPVLHVNNKGTGGSDFDLRNYQNRSNLVNPFSTTSNIFNNNVLNTNKGVTTFTGNAFTHLRSKSGLTFLNISSFTHSTVFRYGGPSVTQFLWINSTVAFSNFAGITISRLANPPSITVILNSSTSYAFTVPLTTRFNNYHIITVAVNQYNLNVYYDDAIITSATLSTNIHPVTAAQAAPNCRISINENYGGVNEAVTNTNGYTQEVIISRGTTLNEDQVFKLHQYFKTKYAI